MWVTGVQTCALPILQLYQLSPVSTWSISALHGLLQDRVTPLKAQTTAVQAYKACTCILHPCVAITHQTISSCRRTLVINRREKTYRVHLREGNPSRRAPHERERATCIACTSGKIEFVHDLGTGPRNARVAHETPPRTAPFHASPMKPPAYASITVYRSTHLDAQEKIDHAMYRNSRPRCTNSMYKKK